MSSHQLGPCRCSRFCVYGLAAEMYWLCLFLFSARYWYGIDRSSGITRGRASSQQMTIFVLCKETWWTKTSEHINPCLVSCEVTYLSTTVTYPEDGNAQTCGCFAAAPAARHANSSNCWIPCCGDEINALSSLSVTARDTDWEPESFLLETYATAVTGIISPLIYMVMDQVSYSSLHTQHSKCRCPSFEGLKTFFFFARFLPKLGTRMAAVGPSAEPVSVSSHGHCSQPRAKLCGSCAWGEWCQSIHALPIILGEVVRDKEK